MEILKNLLPNEVTTVLLNEEATAEAKKKAWEKWMEEQREVTRHKAVAEFKDTYIKEHGEEVYIKATAKFKDRLKKKGGFTSEDIKDKTPEELLDELDSRYQTQIKEAGEGKNENYIKQINELKETLQAKDEDIKAWGSKFEEQGKEVERKIKEFHTERYLDSRYHTLEFDDKDKAPLYIGYLNQELSRFSINHETGEITNTDGTKVLSPDGETMWKTADDAIQYYANKNKMTKKSNGGSGGDPHVPGGGGAPEPKVDQAALDALASTFTSGL